MNNLNFTIDRKKYQDIVFGSHVTSAVPELSHYKEEINQFFSKNRLTAHTSDLDQIQKSILDAELVLEKTFISFNNEQKLSYLNSLVREIPEVNETPFLSDAKIREILQELPPAALNTFLNRNSQLLSLSPREKLSLTRFSEGKEWQDKYHEILSDTTSSDYERRLPKIISVDADSFSKLTQNSGNTLKPWGISHCKETGVIIFFEDFTPNVASPNFLMFSVFLHYLFEVHHFSSFIESRGVEKTGNLVKDILRERKPKFTFLTDGNAHDETLYWKKAFDHLSTFAKFDNSKTSEHLKSLTIKNGELKSLNFIDVLWNMNDVYPSSETIYHLQQEAWYQILEHIEPTNNFDQIVAESLTLDNRSFLKKIVS